MRTLSVITGLVVSTCFGSAYAEMDTTSVHLHKTTSVGTTQFFLSDVANIHTEDSTLKNKLETMALGSTPRIGYSVYVTRQQIEKQLDTVLHGPIRWSGSETVLVRSVGTEFDLSAHVSRARDLLHSRWKQAWFQPDRIDIQSVQEPSIIVVPRGSIEVDLRIIENDRLNKRQCVWFDVTVDGEHYRSIPVWFSVKAYKPVLIARRPLPKWQEIRQDDFVLSVQDVAGFSNAVSTISEEMVSSWLNRPLREGEVLSTDDLEEMPLVRRGDNVLVTFSHGSVEIETMGVAQVHGRLGEVVRVQNKQSLEIYAAQVTGAGTVTVKTR